MFHNVTLYDVTPHANCELCGLLPAEWLKCACNAPSQPVALVLSHSRPILSIHPTFHLRRWVAQAFSGLSMSSRSVLSRSAQVNLRAKGQAEVCVLSFDPTSLQVCHLHRRFGQASGLDPLGKRKGSCQKLANPLSLRVRLIAGYEVDCDCARCA